MMSYKYILLYKYNLMYGFHCMFISLKKMKSYFRYFRHVRGWYYPELFSNARLENRIKRTLTSFFELRLVYWLRVKIKRMTRNNALYRAPGLVLTPFYCNDGLLIDETCSSQNNYVKTLVSHPNVHTWTKVYTRIQNRYEYQILPRYI